MENGLCVCCCFVSLFVGNCAECRVNDAEIVSQMIRTALACPKRIDGLGTSGNGKLWFNWKSQLWSMLTRESDKSCVRVCK